MAISSNIKVIPHARIKKTRSLNMPGEVLVKVGDVVTPDTVLAKTDYVRGNPRIVDLNAEFRMRLTPEMVDDVMLKKVGDVVKGQEVMARYQKSFWSEIKEVNSPCDGKIEHISRIQKRVIIREDPRSSKPLVIVQAAKHLDIRPWMLKMHTQIDEGDFVYQGQTLAAVPQNTLFGDSTTAYVYAPMSGVVEEISSKTGDIKIARPIKPARVVAHIRGIVTEIIPLEGAVVESTGAYLEGVFGVGGEKFGELVVATPGPDQALTPEALTQLPQEIKGKIVLAGSLATLEALNKLRDLGAQGLIVGGLNNYDLVRFLGHEINVGITGQEESGLTVIIMEGFGSIPMSHNSWDLLSSKAGKVASIDGTTHIRAGAIRPQILVSTGDKPEDTGDSPKAHGMDVVGDAYGEPKEENLRPLTNLVLGDRVRCVRAPHFGLWGVVQEIPSEPWQVESEAFMEAAKIKLDTGPVVMVPEANLEVFRD